MSNDDGFSALFRAEYPAAARAAALIVGDIESGRDVAQEAFVRVHLHWAKVSRYDKPGAWARRVTIRLAVKEVQRNRRGRSIMHLVARREEVEPNDVAVDVVGALAALPAQQRAAIVCHYLLDMPVAEVAKALGVRSSTAKVHLYRGRERLGEQLKEEVTNDTRYAD